MNRMIVPYTLPWMMVALLAIGCGETATESSATPVVEPGHQSDALVVPTIELVGLDEVPDDTTLEQVDVAVNHLGVESEDPSVGATGGVATTRGEVVTFDVAGGQTEQRWAPVEVSEDERYRLVVEIEAPSDIDDVRDAERANASLAVVGRVSPNVERDHGREADGEDNDGNPLPLPTDTVGSERDGEDDEGDSTPRRVMVVSQDSGVETGSAVGLERDRRDVTVEIDVGALWRGVVEESEEDEETWNWDVDNRGDVDHLVSGLDPDVEVLDRTGADRDE